MRAQARPRARPRKAAILNAAIAGRRSTMIAPEIGVRVLPLVAAVVALLAARTERVAVAGGPRTRLGRAGLETFADRIDLADVERAAHSARAARRQASSSLSSGVR